MYMQTVCMQMYCLAFHIMEGSKDRGEKQLLRSLRGCEAPGFLNELFGNKTLPFPQFSNLLSEEIARIVPISVHPGFIQPSLHESNFPFDQQKKWLCFDGVFKMSNHGRIALWKPLHALSWQRVLISSFSQKKPRPINLLLENQLESFSIKCFPYTCQLNNSYT